MTLVIGGIISVFVLYISTAMEGSRVETFVSRRDLARQNKILAQLSATEALTGVLNRRTLEQHLEIHLDEFVRYGAICSVVLIDLYHFKKVNDTYGHPVGDEVLVQIAELFAQSLRTSDEIARYGGEEFVLVLPHIRLANAAAVAERLRAEVADTRFSH